jgi:hypothetical protein
MKLYALLGVIIAFLFLGYLFNLAGKRIDSQRLPVNEINIPKSDSH